MGVDRRLISLHLKSEFEMTFSLALVVLVSLRVTSGQTVDSISIGGTVLDLPLKASFISAARCDQVPPCLRIYPLDASRIESEREASQRLGALVVALEDINDNPSLYYMHNFTVQGYNTYNEDRLRLE